MSEISKHHLNIKLLANEEILYVERKHWISVFVSLLLHPFIIIIALGILLYLLYQRVPNVYAVISFDLTLCVLCLLAVLGTYLFMDWYYEFYIITNQRLIKQHFFRIVGTHYDELFHRSDAETEVSLVTNNWLYDMLNIEDVQVRFRSLARAEPFVFHTPSNPRKIERILDEISVEKREKML